MKRSPTSLLLWPRHKRSRRKRAKQYLIASGLIALLCFLVWSSHELDQQQKRLDESGVQVTAMVFEKIHAPRYRSRSSDYFHVRFTDQTRLDYDANVDVTKTMYGEYEVGDDIPVIYDPKNPVDAKAQGVHTNYWSWAPWFVGFGFVVLLLDITNFIRRHKH